MYYANKFKLIYHAEFLYGPIPLLIEGYNRYQGGYLLCNVSDVPQDSTMRTFTQRFAELTHEDREIIRRGIGLEEHFALLDFARRCAVFALNESPFDHVLSGLIAVTINDEHRVDLSDATWAVALLSHAIQATGLDRYALVERTKALASDKVARVIETALESSVLSNWGYVEIEDVDFNRGLLEVGQDRFEPEIDMQRLATNLCNFLNEESYVAAPPKRSYPLLAWFERPYQSRALGLLRRANAGIHIIGTLHNEQFPESHCQKLFLWVVEFTQPKDAKALEDYVRHDEKDAQRFTESMTHNSIFVLLVSSSWREDIPPYETPKSIKILAKKIISILNTFSTKNQEQPTKNSS